MRTLSVPRQGGLLCVGSGARVARVSWRYSVVHLRATHIARLGSQRQCLAILHGGRMEKQMEHCPLVCEAQDACALVSQDRVDHEREVYNDAG